VSRPDSMLVGDGFGHCQLQLACDLRHILTIARILSLLKILQSCDVQSGDPRVMRPGKGVVVPLESTIARCGWIPSCTNSSATGCCAKMVGNASGAGRCQILRFTATNFVARPVTIQRRLDQVVR